MLLAPLLVSASTCAARGFLESSRHVQPPSSADGFPGSRRSWSSQAAHFVYTKSVFEWDPRKAEANAAKHGISFEDAVTVFLDPEALDGPDQQHSSAESRFLRLGRSAGGHMLMVAYTFRRSGDAETIRIISARRASRRERAAYEATD